MMATMSLKFLRNGVDSANSLANQHLGGNIFGQTSYNFFEPSLFTNVMDAGFTNEELAEGFRHVNEAIRP